MKKTLRLLLLKECNRNCQGCCNKDWDLDSLEVETDFSQYSEILLTGGEPMLKPELIIEICKKITEQTNVPIYLYTAETNCLLSIVPYINGITLTLHKQLDVESFKSLNNIIEFFIDEPFSLRLNVFKGVSIEGVDVSKWQVKRDMEWIENCPLPKNEVFKRYK